MPSQEQCCTILIPAYVDVAEGKPKRSMLDGKNINEIKFGLEKGDTNQRITIIKKMIAKQINGKSMKPYIMSVMKYCVPEQDHTLKRLLYIFWEVVDKTQENVNTSNSVIISGGNTATQPSSSKKDKNAKIPEKEVLLPEMIMLCSYVRGDLQHPNEYVRGITLRFLTKIKERSIFEPLVSAVIANLSHRVSYVRRNAVLAVHNIYVNSPELIPDAPELIEKFLTDENDISARTNAFNMLVECAEERANHYLFSIYFDSNTGSGLLAMEDSEVFQLAVLGFIKKMSVVKPETKSMYIPIIFAMMAWNDKKATLCNDDATMTMISSRAMDNSSAIQYECATTLLRLSSSPTAIKQAISIFVKLLSTHADNNVRIICLERLKEIRMEHSEALIESVMEFTRAINAQGAYTFHLRMQILALVVDILMNCGPHVNSKQYIEKFVQFLKRELIATHAAHNNEAMAAAAAGEGGVPVGVASCERVGLLGIIAGGYLGSTSLVSGQGCSMFDYCQQQVRALHLIILKRLAHNTDIATGVIPVMLDFMYESSDPINGAVLSTTSVSYDAVVFIKEYMNKLDELASHPHTSPELKGRYLALKIDLLNNLVDRFSLIQSSRVLRGVLWLFGVHCATKEQILVVTRKLKVCMEPFPLFAMKNDGSDPFAVEGARADNMSAISNMTTATVIREDGTYGETVVMGNQHGNTGSVQNGGIADASSSIMRQHIVKKADFFLAAALSSTFAKLVVRVFSMEGAHPNAVDNEVKSTALQMMHEIIKLGLNLGSGSAAGPSFFDNDSHERIRLALTIVNNPQNNASFLSHFVNNDSKNAYNRNVQSNITALNESADGQNGGFLTAGSLSGASTRQEAVFFACGRNVKMPIASSGDPAAPMEFSQLSKLGPVGVGGAHGSLRLSANNKDDALVAARNDTLDEAEDFTFGAATGSSTLGRSSEVTPVTEAFKVNRRLALFMNKLHHVKQLSGRNDPIYIEATVTVHYYDVMIEFFLINQTNQILTNLCIEIASVDGGNSTGNGNGQSGMRVIERPQYYTLSPYGSTIITTNLKVNSTETGIIYGSCLFDVNVNNSNIDIINSQISGFGSTFNNSANGIGGKKCCFSTEYENLGAAYGSNDLFSDSLIPPSSMGSGSSIRHGCVILNEINVAITDYIKPCADISITDFRNMWFVYEWENKIIVNTEITHDLWAYAQRVMDVTNMKLLPDSFDPRMGNAEDGQPMDFNDCPYLSVSLYGRSIFGEHCLINISLEMITAEALRASAQSAEQGKEFIAPFVMQNNIGKIEGVVRIRSKTQAIALGLGERLSKMQRRNLPPGMVN